MMSGERTWMCHRCGYVMDAAIGISNREAVPKEGDVALCMNCGASYSRHADAWVPMTEAEKASLEPDLRDELAKGWRAIAVGAALGVVGDLHRRGSKV